MNKHMIIGILLGGVVATAGGAFALRSATPKEAAIVSVTPITVAMEQQYATVTHVQQRIDPNAPQLADVVSSQPIIAAGATREICEERVVTHQMPPKDEKQIAGTATGAVIGGLLGNQVGGGNGKKAATVLGAIAGGVIGKNVQSSNQAKKTYQTIEQDCRTVRDADRTTGHNVTISLNGQQQNLTMDYAPRGQLPVVNGQVITSKKAIKTVMASIPPAVYSVAYTVPAPANSASAQTQHTQYVDLNYAPDIGAKLPFEYGQVLTTQEQLDNLKARENTVIAYKVMYQSDAGIGEVRMTQHPAGTTLALKNGKPVMTASAQ